MRKVIEDFRGGMERIRWFAALFAERLRIEIAVFKLIFEADKMSRNREALLKKIGERVMELRGYPDKNILKDLVVSEAVTEIARIEGHIGELRHQVSEIGKAAE